MVLGPIKDIYYSLEEKWYAFLDKLDAHVPVYKVIDPIDSVVPSFLLFLLLIILVIAFAGFMVLAPQETYTATFAIKTSDNKPVFDTLITAVLSQNGLDTELSGRTDSAGEIVFTKIPYGGEIAFDINLSKGTFSGSFPVTKSFSQTIQLKSPPIVLQPVTKKIFVKNSNGYNVNENIPLTFSCENSSLAPIPANATFDGTKPVEVIEPVNCRLQASVSTPKYNVKTYQVNSALYDLVLEPLEQYTTSLKVIVRSNGYPVSDTSFKVKLSGQATYEGETKLASEVTIPVQPGTYMVSVSDSRNIYGIATQTAVVNGSTEINVNVQKTVRSRVSVKLIDETTSVPIVGGIVNVKDSMGREIAAENTNVSGIASFAFTDLGDYYFAGKKLGDLNGGYFPKEIKQTLTADANIVLQLTRVTLANAGAVKIRVIDQEGEPVINARAFLKYKTNDGIVELYRAQNYVYTDLNGEASFMAGKVEGLVYAYAIKGAFSGASLEKSVIIDQQNNFEVRVDVGTAVVKANVIDETGKTIDGTAEILTVDGRMIDQHGVSGIISLEGGVFSKQVKAAQTVFVRFKSPTYEDYYSAPITLWPNKTYTINVTMLKQISAPEIKLIGVYNEDNAAVQTMAAGKKYYAKFQVNSDDTYDAVLMHFRVGKETMLENGIMAIDRIESSNITSETRGTTFDSNRGYSYDAEHTTDGPAKWSNVNWGNFGRGTREVKAYFQVNKLASPNAELQFFYRAEFDNTKLPPSTSTLNDLYSDAFSSNIYYVGTEAVCEEGFCANSEWLYSKSDDLYVDAPFGIRQVQEYTYHVTLLNNSEFDYGQNEKPIYLNITVLGDEAEDKRIKIKNYLVRDSVNQLTNNTEIYKAENLNINSFLKDATIDITMDIEGLTDGAEVIRFELKSEGRVIYTKDTSITVVEQKDFSVSISPTFVPALLNTEIDVVALDEKGEYLPGVLVKSFAKEPGFEQYQVDSATTDRLGAATVNSGALFQGAKVILEITKEGYARQTYTITVSSDAIAYSPESLTVRLNTYSKREEIKQIEFANLTQYDLMLKSITLDAKFKDTINEDAMNAYFNELTEEEKIVRAEDTLDLEMLKIRLANSITQGSFVEPVTISGKLKFIFENTALHISYDFQVPTTITVSSEASPGSDCLLIKSTSPTNVNTQRAQARFDFEILNACASSGVEVPLDSLSVTSSAEIPGAAEVSIRSSSGVSAGRTALDGGKRVVLNTVKAGEKLYGTMTFAPSESATGKSITIPLTFEAKFNGRNVVTNPSEMELTTNVINLKECMTIDSDTAPVEFKEKAKITIDTTACLGQKIDVILCKADSGCSGGADGKITLSKKSFTLQNRSTEVLAYNPTYPGTYGVTIYARIRGTTGFAYIGEVPVSFYESSSKFFNLNKFELNLVGVDSQDYLILTNKMLTQDIKVKASGCVWGQKDPGTEWMTVITGAALGATIGNLIGAGFKTEVGKDGKAPSRDQQNQADGEANDSYSKMDQEERAKVATTQTNMKDGLGKIDQSINSGTTADGVTRTTYTSTGADGVTRTTIDRYTTDYMDADGLKHTITVDTSSGINGTRDYTAYDVGNGGKTQAYTITGAQGGSNLSNSSFSRTASINTVDHQSSFLWRTEDLFSGNNTKNPHNFHSGFTSPSNTGGSVPPAGQTTPPSEPVVVVGPAPTTKNPPMYTPPTSIKGADYPNALEKLEKLSFAALNEGAKQTKLLFPALNKTLVKKDNNRASFGIWAGHEQGWFTLIGAVVGGILAYMSQEFDCSDSKYDATKTFTDFVILLQGDSISITSADGEGSITRDVPSDAGELSFSLDGITPMWDFNDSDYSSVENVSLKFTNDALNEPTPLYGTLTVNATTHLHGKLAELESTGISSSTSYDVVCNNSNFGNYWLGSGSNEGSCSGVSTGHYSQKYHLRVITGEATAEDAYLKKASSCYMGALTGATGKDALPRIKLDWDWDSIKANSCDYTNQDYIYCDATQFLIALTKKLANLDEFMAMNGSQFACPPDEIQNTIDDSIDEINQQQGNITEGFIGIRDINVSTIDNESKITVQVENKTGAAQTSYMSYSFKSTGQPETNVEQWTVPAGLSQVEFTFDTPQSNNIYYFVAVMNGEKGDRTSVTRAFRNKLVDTNCWIEQTTRPTAGIPGLLYYVSNIPTPTYTQNIKNQADIYNSINFSVYLTRDAFTEDFFRDFREYYRETLLQKVNVNAEERAIVDYLTSGNFIIRKKFSGDNTIEAGLYNVWVKLDSPNQFRVVDGNNTSVVVELLLVKKPSIDSPFYNMPFDGVIGTSNGRQGYGSMYRNNDEKTITISNANQKVYSFDNAVSNAVMTITTNTKTSFDVVNASIGTRGQVASASVSGSTGQLTLTPNYATPVIVKQTQNSTIGQMAYSVENTRKAISTGGNIGYWTGASKSKDFYGGNAVELFTDSPDYRLNNLGENVYGFKFEDTTRNGTMYLKSFFFVPEDGTRYQLVSKDDDTIFWTTSSDFSNVVELLGIPGMEYNSLQNNSSLSSLQDLFTAVENMDICVSNDGSNTTFWWNPAVIENTTGSTTSLANKELELIGK
jgi:hypothetical protein